MKPPTLAVSVLLATASAVFLSVDGEPLVDSSQGGGRVRRLHDELSFEAYSLCPSDR